MFLHWKQQCCWIIAVLCESLHFFKLSIYGKVEESGSETETSCLIILVPADVGNSFQDKFIAYVHVLTLPKWAEIKAFPTPLRFLNIMGNVLFFGVVAESARFNLADLSCSTTGRVLLSQQLGLDPCSQSAHDVEVCWCCTVGCRQSSAEPSRLCIIQPDTHSAVLLSPKPLLVTHALCHSFHWHVLRSAFSHSRTTQGRDCILHCDTTYISSFVSRHVITYGFGP